MDAIGFKGHESSTKIEKQFNKSSYAQRVNFKSEPDEFVKTSKSEASNDGKFTAKEALLNLGKGLISPITVLAKHPIATLGTLAGVGLACFAVPALTPILTVGFGALSLFQLGNSTVNTIRDYSKGNYDNAEKGFKGIGEGIIGTLTTMLGLKSSAKIAAETKALSEAGVKTLSATTKNQIATQVSEGSYLGALKEHFSLIFTKEGWKSIGNEFKPSIIKDRFVTFANAFKKIFTTSRDDAIKNFKNSEEGIRRANLSEEQLNAEIQGKFNQALDELGIPQEQRPKLNIAKGKETQGGSYSQQSHTLNINPEAYKAGVFELDDVIMHEATHCREAILRASLPQDKVDEIILNDLVARISNGENEQILVSFEFLSPNVMDAPKLPTGMKQDFISFAKQHLYKRDSAFNNNLREYVNSKRSLNIEIPSKTFAQKTLEVEKASKEITSFLDELHALLDKHPDFVSGYKTKEEAIFALEQYALSHNTRYRCFTNNKINGVVPKTLNAEDAILAEKSLIGYVDTIEGNAANTGFNNMFGNEKRFNQYQFSPEEVLAQENGNNFVIRNYKAKLAEMRQNGTLTPETEAYLTGAIKKANATIAYKKKGLEFYEVYKLAKNNPNDEALAKQLAVLKKELSALDLELSANEVKQILESLNSSGVPINILPASAILYD